MPAAKKSSIVSVDMNPVQFNQDLDSYVDQMFEQLVRAVSDAVSENENLRNYVAQNERSLEELQATLVFFQNFAQTYYVTIKALTSAQDHERLSQAIRKIQQELFALRRLVEQRWSRNLWRLLRLADRWSNAYLASLILPDEDPGSKLSYRRRPVVTIETDGAINKGALSSPRSRAELVPHVFRERTPHPHEYLRL